MMTERKYSQYDPAGSCGTQLIIGAFLIGLLILAGLALAADRLATA